MNDCYILLHVRPGFEDDAKHELEYHFQRLSVTLSDISATENTGLITAKIPADRLGTLREKLRWSEFIFARQMLWSTGGVTLPKTGDRLTDLLTIVHTQLIPLSGSNAFSSFTYETSDADDAKELSGFCKSLSRPTENALNKLRLLPKGKGAAHLPRLHLLMTSPEEVWPAFSDQTNSSPWPMGIPRLKFPPQAPSRSTLKLEEAFITFLGYEAMDERLKPGMMAVDLGACPGGWTYQLVKRGVHVAAVDNGEIDATLMATGLVEHVKADAFSYRPALPVDWLVCDVVEQPARIADLMTQWLTKGWCNEAIFNLKLPMKKRWEETQACLKYLEDTCRQHNTNIEIKCKQLYHDRKEVTVHVKRHK